MEAAVQKFVQQPEHCNTEAAAKIERASFALTEYLQGVLSDQPGVTCFAVSLSTARCRNWCALTAFIPLILWPLEWRWLEPELAIKFPVGGDTAATFAFPILDQAVLKLMKGRATRPAADLRDLCLGFSAAQTSRQPRIFWKIASCLFRSAWRTTLIEPDLVRSTGKFVKSVCFSTHRLAKGRRIHFRASCPRSALLLRASMLHRFRLSATADP